jgi:hypothetical protein
MSPGGDGCRVRTGEAPEIRAAVRDAGLWLWLWLWLSRSSGLSKIAAALRRHAAEPLGAMRMVRNFAPS